MIGLVCFCQSKTAYEMRISDWSSDVCSSDLVLRHVLDHHRRGRREAGERDQPGIRPRVRPRPVAGGDDVENGVEMPAAAPPLPPPFGMPARALGAHELTPRRSAQHGLDARPGPLHGHVMTPRGRERTY